MAKPKKKITDLFGTEVDEPQRRFTGAKQRRVAIKDPITGERSDVTDRARRKYEVAERTGLGPDTAQKLHNELGMDLSSLKKAKRKKGKPGFPKK